MQRVCIQILVPWAKKNIISIRSWPAIHWNGCLQLPGRYLYEFTRMDWKKNEYIRGDSEIDCLTGYTWASSVCTDLRWRRSLLFPTSMITILESAWSLNSFNQRSMLSKLTGGNTELSHCGPVMTKGMTIKPRRLRSISLVPIERRVMISKKNVNFACRSPLKGAKLKHAKERHDFRMGFAVVLNTQSMMLSSFTSCLCTKPSQMPDTIKSTSIISGLYFRASKKIQLLLELLDGMSGWFTENQEGVSGWPCLVMS